MSFIIESFKSATIKVNIPESDAFLVLFHPKSDEYKEIQKKSRLAFHGKGIKLGADGNFKAEYIEDVFQAQDAIDAHTVELLCGVTKELHNFKDANGNIIEATEENIRLLYNYNEIKDLALKALADVQNFTISSSVK
jgi:hypothetical protein